MTAEAESQSLIGEPASEKPGALPAGGSFAAKVAAAAGLLAGVAAVAAGRRRGVPAGVRLDRADGAEALRMESARGSSETLPPLSMTVGRSDDSKRVLLRSRTGCSNFEDMLVDTITVSSADVCENQCRNHHLGCDGFAVNVCSGGENCHLLVGGCEESDSTCWNLYTLEDALAPVDPAWSTPAPAPLPPIAIGGQVHETPTPAPPPGAVAKGGSVRRSGSGCSNWMEILVGDTLVRSPDACEGACRLHPRGCAFFGVSTCADDDLPEGKSRCFLYSGNCQSEDSSCWDMYTLTDRGDELEEAPITAISSAPSCMVTCSSGDGVGHQIESKLTCIGVAAAMGMEYIHTHITETQHGSDPEYYERFFGLSMFGRGYFASEMSQRDRNYTTCGNPDPSWCAADGKSVYHQDNCNDLFFCPDVMDRWPQLVPAIQYAFDSTAKPDPDWFQGFKHGNWGKKVVAHIRRGDTAYPVETEYFVRMVKQLRVELAATWQFPPLFRVQTDATTDELLNETPELRAEDVIIDDISTPLDLAIVRMVKADIFVMSPSSLSVTAALIGNHSRVLAPCLVGRTHPPNASILHWEKDQANCPKDS